MSRANRFVLAAVCVAAIACGPGDPDQRTTDWEDSFNRANQATAAGEHDRAIAVGEAFLKKHPDNVDGHLMIASAAVEAARAASDASRPARFEQASTHYARALELSKNPTWRLLALMGMIEVYGTHGLNKPDDVERFARMLVAEDPRDIKNHVALVNALKNARKFDELAATLARARSEMKADADAVTGYGGMVHDVVLFTPDFPRDSGRQLLADAVALGDEALGRYGRTEGLLRTKGMLLRGQAELEPDSARQQALMQESRRTFDELDRLGK
jgi:tetratricopeptide (TPR) repeat protein